MALDVVPEEVLRSLLRSLVRHHLTLVSEFAEAKSSCNSDENMELSVNYGQDDTVSYNIARMMLLDAVRTPAEKSHGSHVWEHLRKVFEIREPSLADWKWVGKRNGEEANRDAALKELHKANSRVLLLGQQLEEAVSNRDEKLRRLQETCQPHWAHSEGW